MGFVNNQTDTLFADVSEFNPVVTDEYTDAGYRVLSIRSNDGTYQDHHFAANYAWCAQAADDGRLDCFIVYAYWRPNWLDTVTTMRSMITAAGGPHPKMVLMLDVESGGNPPGDQSDGVNRMYWNLVDWIKTPERIIGYANAGDLATLWPTRPDGIRLIGAGYGQNPELPGQIAHQYTDGLAGADQGLPMGVNPFGTCDMNCADGLSSVAFAQALGVDPHAAPPPVPVTLPELPLDDSIYAAANAIAAQFQA